MKTKLHRSFVALAWLGLSTLNLQFSTAHAQGTAFTYQGQLNAGGNPANGNYDLQFTLYDASANGTAIGSLTNAATAVSNGLFTATLDFGSVFAGSNYWLEIAVRTNGSGTFSTLSPRQPIMPTPYAVYSANAGSAATATTAGSANSVSAANIVGSVSLAQLPGSVVTNNQNGVTLAGAFTGNGGGLTNLNAASLTGANALPIGVLPANVAFLNSNQTFTGINIFNNNVGIGTTSPATALDVNGTVTATALTLNGNLNLPATTATIYSGSSTLLRSDGLANFFSGPRAGNVTMTGGQNTAIGVSSLQANTTGIQNTANGCQALFSNTTGYDNVANGYQALYANTTGYNNTANGYWALQNNTSGYQNAAYGDGALRANTTGIQNTANGSGALQNNTTGSQNTAAGYHALYANTTGYHNTANGFDALVLNTTGYFNTANGMNTLYQNTTGTYNTANGNTALYSNTTGSYNTGNGEGALYSNTTGSYNTANGENALLSNTTGNYNIAEGYQAGYNITTGSSNIDIGNLGAATDSNVIRIGSRQTQAFIAGVITGNGSGLTNLNASQLSSGAIPLAQLPAAAVTNNQSGVSLNGTFTGNGAGLTGITASALAIPPGMALIPAGAFTMGNSINDADIPDASPTNVTVSAFYMDVNLVSYSQWLSVYFWATNTGYGFDNAGAGKAANHPVQTVDWYDAVKWCNARSQQVGLTPVYYTDAGFTQVYANGDVNAVYASWAANGYRLPTEAEWEKAARAGLSGQRFPWGNVITESLANYYGDTSDYGYDLGPDGYNAAFTTGPNPYTSPAGSFAPNAYGLYDMAGNVTEWCWDWYGTPYAGGSDPRGPATGSDRDVRGGVWSARADYSRCANRGHSNPVRAYDDGGFRCVRGL